MFSGIVEGVGTIIDVVVKNKSSSIAVDYACLENKNLKIGDSVAVNGVCLTISQLQNSVFNADISSTTMQITNLGGLKKQSLVNLEGALTLQQAINGHLVSGHVDATTTIQSIKKSDSSLLIKLSIPDHLSNYIAPAGSMTLDGVSLTVNQCDSFSATVTLIPHTIKNTILKYWSVGNQVNLEIDILARYIQRLLPKDT